VTGTSHFSEHGGRGPPAQRRVVDHATIDWNRGCANRLSMLGSRKQAVWSAEGLQELSLQLGFRAVDGFCRARDLPRTLSAGPDRARQSRRGHAGDAAEHVATSPAREEVEDPAQVAQAAARRARAAARCGEAGVVSPRSPEPRSNCTNIIASIDLAWDVILLSSRDALQPVRPLRGR